MKGAGVVITFVASPVARFTAGSLIYIRRHISACDARCTCKKQPVKSEPRYARALFIII